MSALMTGKLIDLIYKYISIYFMAVGMNLRLLVRSKSHLAFKDIHALSIIGVLQKRKKIARNNFDAFEFGYNRALA